MTRNELAAAAYAKAREAAEIVEGVPADEIVTDGAAESALVRLEEARNAILALQTCIEHNVLRLAVSDMVTAPDPDLARDWGLAPFREDQPVDPAADVEAEERVAAYEAAGAEAGPDALAEARREIYEEKHSDFEGQVEQAEKDLRGRSVEEVCNSQELLDATEFVVAKHGLAEDCGVAAVLDALKPVYTNARVHGPGCKGDTAADRAEAAGEVFSR